MAERIDPTTASRLLTAFADGELDAAQGPAVARYLAGHPEAAARVEAAARFREAVGRSMAAVPGPSAGLRASLARLSEESARLAPPDATGGAAAPLRLVPDPAARAAPARAARRWSTASGRLLAAAASVAFLVLGLSVGRLLTRPNPTAAGAGPVPLTLIAAATRTHVDCSRYPNLHANTWPVPLNNLGPPLLKYLNRPVPYPDLLPVGYKYIGAGPCAKPLERAAHVLYQSVESPADTISLFVQEYDGKMPVAEGKTYRGAGPDAAHPMLIWRHENMVFYLVGDAAKPVEQAAEAMRLPAPA